MCEDGYYGDPLGQSGPVRPCQKCDCNGNVDFNAIGICDHITGRCLKCLEHTEGDHCQHCQRAFYGNALNQTAGQKCKREWLWKADRQTANNYYYIYSSLKREPEILFPPGLKRCLTFTVRDAELYVLMLEEYFCIYVLERKKVSLHCRCQHKVWEIFCSLQLIWKPSLLHYVTWTKTQSWLWGAFSHYISENFFKSFI